MLNQYTDLATLQKELDKWLEDYNNHRTHRGKMFRGLTLHMVTLFDGLLVGKKSFLG